MNDRPATKWEESYFKLRRNRRRRQSRLRWFDWPPGARLLDYGCGDGLDLALCRADGYHRLFGLDESIHLLRYVRAAPVVQADGISVPFANGTFDTVLVDNVLHHLDLERSLSEISRVLRLGGRLCMLEPAGGLARRALDRATFSPLSRLVPWLAYRRLHIGEEWHTYSNWLGIEQTVVGSLARFGFAVLRLRREPLTLFVEAIRSGG